MNKLRAYALLSLLTMTLSTFALQLSGDVAYADTVALPDTSALPDTVVIIRTDSVSAAQPDTLSAAADTLSAEAFTADSLAAASLAALTVAKKPSFLERCGAVGRWLKRLVDSFDDINPEYIEPIGYNFTAMGQVTTNFERYTISLDDYSQTLSFRQRPDLRVGPYFGWRWLFFGYTYDMTSFGKSAPRRGSKTEFSLYTSRVGIDLMWRRTGSDFYLRKVHGFGDAGQEYEGRDIEDYISTSITGLNFYYIFNYHKFSNPAIFSQSTIQRKSAGSWQLGFGVTAHDIRFNYEALPAAMFSEVATNQYATLSRAKYMNYNISVGYGYNWVFHRGWCLGISLMPALGYKWASAQTAVFAGDGTEDAMQGEGSNVFSQKIDEIFRKRGNLNLDVTGRMGIIYNTGRWFVGLFGIVHNYNYRRDEILFTDVFGNVNLCSGFYFQKRKR